MIECLATVLYLEARGEGVTGMEAVADVVLERVEDPRWPGDVCAVVQQDGQFAYVGNLDPAERAAWAAAQAVAANALSGALKNTEVEGATHFHADSVNPGWGMTFIGRVGSHVFWREE